MMFTLAALIVGMLLAYIITHVAYELAVQREANRIRVEVGLPVKPVKVFR